MVVTKFIRILTVVAALVVAMAKPTLSMQAPPAIAEVNDPEAYAVYASVLPATFSSADTDRSAVVLFQETRPSMNCLRQAGAAAGPEWSAVLENYRVQNAAVYRLRPDFNLGLPYRLVSLADIDAVVVKVPEQFLPQYPGTQFYLRGGHGSFPNQKLYFLSAVGFNEDKTRAFVTVQYNCGFDCAGGRQYVREKLDGRWVQPKDILVSCRWIA